MCLLFNARLAHIQSMAKSMSKLKYPTMTKMSMKLNLDASWQRFKKWSKWSKSQLQPHSQHQGCQIWQRNAHCCDVMKLTSSCACWHPKIFPMPLKHHHFERKDDAISGKTVQDAGTCHAFGKPTFVGECSSNGILTQITDNVGHLLTKNSFIIWLGHQVLRWRCAAQYVHSDAVQYALRPHSSRNA